MPAHGRNEGFHVLHEFVCEALPGQVFPSAESKKQPLAMPVFDGDPFHSILDEPWTWQLAGFVYHRDFEDWRASYVDMVFKRDGQTRRLRFIAPQDLEMSKGMPNSMGMCIVDVSARQLDGLRVRVANFEQSFGAPTFWAANVIELAE